MNASTQVSPTTSRHTIHGVTCDVSVVGGYMSDISRGRCIGKVVNLCRQMPAADFMAVMEEARCNRARGWFGGPLQAAMLERLDTALGDYPNPKGFSDYPPPSAGVDEVEVDRVSQAFNAWLHAVPRPRVLAPVIKPQAVTP